MEQEILRHINEACKEDVEEGELSENEKEKETTELNPSMMFVNDTINETETERKVRLGEMTPFGSVLQSSPNLRYILPYKHVVPKNLVN